MSSHGFNEFLHSLILLRRRNNNGQPVSSNLPLSSAPPTSGSQDDVRMYIQETLQRSSSSSHQIDSDELIDTMVSIWSSLQRSSSEGAVFVSQPSSSVTSFNQSAVMRDSVSYTSISTSSSSRSTRSRRTVSSLLTVIDPKHYITKFMASVKIGDTDKLDKLQAHVTEAVLDEALLMVTKEPSIECDRTRMARYLLQAGASRLHTDPEENGRTLVIWAIIMAQKTLVRLFLDEKDAISLELLDKRDLGHNLSPLIWAIRLGRNEIADYLVDRGADLEIGDWVLQRTPLHWAAMVGNCHAASLLLGRDPILVDLPDVNGSTPVAFAYPLVVSALKCGRGDLARLFIEKNAPVDSNDPQCDPILLVAAKNAQYDIVQLILERKNARAQTTPSEHHPNTP